MNIHFEISFYLKEIVNETQKCDEYIATISETKISKSENTMIVEYSDVKKDEIKVMPAVVPVLGYTPAPAPNVYSTLDSGIPMFSGTQPAPAHYPTTYQQGVNID